ncbi:MAG TPA: NifU family protein [Bacteroidetes bacterium]|nr:NifU family protein [Bacteroidota bacterium]
MPELDREKVETVLEKVRIAIQMDGGDVELVDVDGGVVKVRMLGACGGCPFSQMTLQMGIEQALREELPELERVEAV